MIGCNGIVELCLPWGGFVITKASAALAVLAALTTLTLILANVATAHLDR